MQCCKHGNICVHEIMCVLVVDQEPGSTVLVAGATGGVGQLVTAKLLEVSYYWKFA